MAGEIGYLVLFPASLSCLPSLLFIHFLGVIVFSVEAPMDSTPPPSENGKKFAFITPVLKDSTTTNSKSRGLIVLQKREGKAEGRLYWRQIKVDMGSLRIKGWLPSNPLITLAIHACQLRPQVIFLMKVDPSALDSLSEVTKG